MDIQELKTKRADLEEKISALLSEFEESTNVHIEDISMVRQGSYSGLGTELSYRYVVGIKVEI